MQTQVDSESGLIDVLRKKLSKGQSVLIGVDGFMGSGKSRLAMKLASVLGGYRISLDSYADPGSDEAHYVAKLLLEYFVDDVDKLKGKFPCIVIEGICLLEVMERAKRNLDTLVYVKRISEQGLWHDGFHLEDYVTNKAIKENEQGLHKSEFDYHVAKVPHEKAEIIFERTETNGA